VQSVVFCVDLRRTDDEFNPVRWAERLEGDIPDCELFGREADH
jgi:hypothetical protein